MTSAERTQLLEDIKKANQMRTEIVARAEAAKAFSIVAAWKAIDEIDGSINLRILDAAPND